MRRSEVWWADLPLPVGRRPVLIPTRNKTIDVHNAVTVALITRTIRDIAVEVRLDGRDGMSVPCVVNLDSINTYAKSRLTERITTLSGEKMAQVEAAIRYALGMRDR